MENIERFAGLGAPRMADPERLPGDESAGRRIPESVYTIFLLRALLPGVGAIWPGF